MSPRRLRVLHLTVSDYGGAGVACLRLHGALQKLGVESRVFVRKRMGEDPGIVQTDSKFRAAMRFRLDRLPLRLYPRRRVFAWWSVNWVRGAPALNFSEWDPDIVHLHWIGDGFVPPEWLASIGKPIVWTMHDMWPFTGGCHYAWTCERYETGCGLCPQLGSARYRDLSSYSAARKAGAWSRLQGAAVAPSPWLAEAARRSSAMRRSRIEVIPNGLDGTKFTPGHREDARRMLKLRDDERILLTGAVGAVKEERKGFSLLVDALHACRAVGKTMKWRLLVFGADTGPG